MIRRFFSIKWILRLFTVCVLIYSCYNLYVGCAGNKLYSDMEEEVISTPFGDVVKEGADIDANDETVRDIDYDLPQIEESGVLIALTIEGKETFYELHRRALGEEYLLAEKFARAKGFFIRGELCKDTAELVEKLQRGVGDFIAVPLREDFLKSKDVQLLPVGVTKKGVGAWAVRRNSTKLKKALDDWYRPELRKTVRNEEQMLTQNGMQRRYHSPFFNRRMGKISAYDVWFKRYARVCNWDWRLLAAQCYQESMFDPEAQSFVGACGLMQLMPSTAVSMGLTQRDIFEPEKNIKVATKYIKKLTAVWSDIPGKENRIKFVLASYNGGTGHIRDAQALAKADGVDDYKNWDTIAPYLLKLQDPKVYSNSSVVKNGYMRSSETVAYVENIMRRWREYRSVAR